MTTRQSVELDLLVFIRSTEINLELQLVCIVLTHGTDRHAWTPLTATATNHLVSVP